MFYCLYSAFCCIIMYYVYMYVSMKQQTMEVLEKVHLVTFHLCVLAKAKKKSFTFGIVVCEQLDVKLFSKGCQVRRHHTAGGQVHLVAAGLHLARKRKEKEHSQ